jgi:predicted RNA-binding protein with PIN domain
MSGFGGVWPRVLAKAIDASRLLLQDLDTPEIPASLARVAASQGGRLPPPLATRLLDEIDSNEWFRSRLAERYSGQETDPSWLFINRPPGWWIAVAAAAEALAAGNMARRIEELEDRLGLLEEKRSQAVRRAREFKKTAADAEKRLKQATAAARQGDSGGRSFDAAEIDLWQTQLETTEAALAALRAEHRELQGSFDTLRSRFAKTRRARSAESSGGASGSFVPRDPVKLARMLDLQTGAFGRDLTEPPPAAPAKPAIRLPAGVRPDSSDAMRWLLSLEQPVVVVVDGYNAQFHMDPGDFTSGAARRNLIDALKRLRTAAAAPHRIVVVFDSTLPGAREARSAIGGVEVRFAEDDRIADEEIIEAAAELDEVVVISSDRAVRDGADAKGAVVLWSEALVGWLERS